MIQSGQKPASQGASETEIARARESYGRRAWVEAFDLFSEMDRGNGDGTGLSLEDLERFAWSASLIGRTDVSLKVLERLYRTTCDAGDKAKAARYAFWLTTRLHVIGESGRASGWSTRLQQLAEDAGADGVERGYWLVLSALRALMMADLAGAGNMAEQAAKIGESVGDADLRTFARCQLARAMMRQGKVADGLAMLDECMLAATTGELSPVATVFMYCVVIAACHAAFALERAREWTTVLADWCESQPQLAAFRGTCMVDRAEILRISGNWSQAMEQAERAVAGISGVQHPESIGEAHYQRAEVHRLRGDLEAAEQAYKSASQAGAQPQPGFGLLRLEQGDHQAASNAIRRALAEAREPVMRAKLLPAAIEILLRIDAVEEARTACRELEEIATRFETEVLEAHAAHARATLHLHDGDAQAALGPLRRAFWVWQKVGAPHAAARVRVDLARACEALGDREGAELERSAARSVFQELGAALDLAAIASDKPEPATGSTHTLTQRELQVLRLVATGKTNKAIAKELGVSEKTVDRHVSNIFGKVNVATRTAATAFAYENHLIEGFALGVGDPTHADFVAKWVSFRKRD